MQLKNPKIGLVYKKIMIIRVQRIKIAIIRVQRIKIAKIRIKKIKNTVKIFKTKNLVKIKV